MSRGARSLARFAGPALLLGIVLAGCGRAPDSPRAATNAAARIVVMSPGAAEMLAALGAGDQVVGIGDWVSWPPALAARPRVGAYDSPNLERVLALHPSLYVTTQGVAGQAALATLRRLGVRTLELDTARLAGTLAAIEQLGAEVGRGAAARQLAAELRADLDRLRLRAAAAPRRRVLCVVGRDPLYVAGPGSYLDDLIAIGGGSNVAADTGQP
ncbi:MAG: helical backbone metal receptor, partial [Acidobacteriota bacterium]